MADQDEPEEQDEQDGPEPSGGILPTMKQTGHFFGKLTQLFMNNDERNELPPAFEDLSSLETANEKV
jgi:hypothetical protein